MSLDVKAEQGSGMESSFSRGMFSWDIMFSSIDNNNIFFTIQTVEVIVWANDRKSLQGSILNVWQPCKAPIMPYINTAA